MPRFFISASNIFGGIAYLSGQDANHMKVLRIKSGETFTVCDGAGTDYVCRLKEDAGSDGLEAEILETRPSQSESPVSCRVFAAFSKGDKIETVVQKCVELGAGEIVIFPSSRCVSRPEGAAVLKKTARWQKIAEEAAKQSERGIIPRVSAAPSYAAAVADAAAADLPLFCYECEKQQSLKSLLFNSAEPRTVSIMTGPEGGFTPEEAQLAADAGMISVSLGPRILRCETAPIFALSAIMMFAM